MIYTPYMYISIPCRFHALWGLSRFTKSRIISIVDAFKLLHVDYYS